jgi:hypothetical protein
MAFFKYFIHLHQSDEPIFDQIYEPESRTPYSGLYRCTGCGGEIVSESGRPFPSHNHHRHEPEQGSIRWQLLVW